MTKTQRAILIITGLFMLLFAFSNVTDPMTQHATLATAQFVIAMGLFFWAAKKG